MNIMQIMKQAQSIQSKLKASQEELAKMELTGEAAGGAVKVICDGQGKFKSIKLNASELSISSDTAEELEDLITVAINQASNKASKEMEAKMKAATGGMSIPGLGF
ncbi:TPA: YbaB/EbfC family nucleoid-associated protein [Candidatus Scatousia excrementigallinarum]|mgnify:FL=1|uniref:Nucleoid-associated protein IAC10_14145 n=1 Tax=Candidatus Scatousia excrementigallinarum TaxID=2840935 RepID=A0A9D1JP62_9BACT|nr:YbaB/EbfC family nucleoid-associated protein [Candidatus Scatousia excrementigallinarum]